MTRALRVGVDARWLGGRPTGVGRYLSELLREWRELPDAARHIFRLFTPSPGETPTGRGMQVRPVAGAGGTWWEQVQLPLAIRGEELDVFFAPGYSAPAALRAPVVLTVHDASFAARPEWFGWREGVRRRLLARRGVRTAAVTITDTEFSRREIVERLGADPARVRVIPLGRPRRGTGADPKPREPLVLFVGSVFTRRHVPDLIRAFAAAARSRPAARLVVAGENRSSPPEDLAAVAADAGVAGSVELRSYVSEEGLADLYARASVFAFLSEYEGFGLTPLEALAAGVPIVVSDTPVAREVYGDAAEYVPVGDAAAAAAALEKLLGSDAARADLLARAPAVLARYSWTRTASETLAAIEAAAGSRPITVSTTGTLAAR